MSYSIVARAATKQAAKAAITAKFDADVLAVQAVHKTDRDQALAVAHAFIEILPDDDSKDVAVSLNGSVSGPIDESGATVYVTSVSVYATAYLAERTEAQA